MTTMKPEGNVSTDPVHLEARRRARIRLLQDLVRHGLYRVDTDVLAETMLQKFRAERSGA